MGNYVIPQLLNNSTILLDTNFFIDSYSHSEGFKEFISSIKKANIELVTINFVKFEFICSKTIDVVKKKEKYFNELVRVILPFDKQAENQTLTLIEEYKQYMEGLPLTDLVLGACLKRYRGLYLFTRDHKDFPTSIYNRIHIFNIGLVRDIKTYGIYAYKSKKEILEEEIPF